MKIHFGIILDYGDYESPLFGCEETLCGYIGEIPCENAVDNWSLVICKKCLKLKDSYESGKILDEKAILEEMGNMADFFKKLEEV